MLYETISNDMKEAMKAHDKETLNTIRLLKSAIDLYLVNNKMERNTCSDEIVIDIVSKQVKTHKESIEEFKKGNRQDLVDNLLREINLLSKYLPKQLTKEEITAEIDKVFDKIKPTSMKDMGLIMKELTPIFRGKADMKTVNEIVRSKLN
ncbi:MAG: GatB/YqeY domain-containing protein [Tenericutes bacterium]|nr:GatB/YqeY domain-containing protein [Mycoplasmatota bacterium]